MSYIYSPPRRRRRGVWLLAVLSVAIVVVVLVTSFRSERRLLAAYIDAAQESAAGAAAASEEFLDLADRLAEVDRQEFITTMEGIRASSDAAGALLGDVEVPTDALDAHARLELAHGSWLLGLDLAEGAVLAAADDPSDDVSASVVEQAVIELAVGDRAYESAVGQLRTLEADADVAIPSYPVIVFTPEGGAGGMITAARFSARLSQRRDLAVTAVGFEPRMLGETDSGAGIIPFTNRLIVNVTITNQGNEPAAAVPLQVVLASDRTGTSRSEAVTVERLEPAESTSLEFVFDVIPIVNYELLISVGGVDGETDLENNVLVTPFVVNEQG